MNSAVRPRKPELIIRENEPKELPPDVVRGNNIRHACVYMCETEIAPNVACPFWRVASLTIDWLCRIEKLCFI